MKTVKVEGRKLRISAPEIRGLQAIRALGFVSLLSDLHETRTGGWGTSLVSSDPDRAALLGIRKRQRHWRHGESHSAAAKRFWKDHPRAIYAYEGNRRRINSILRQVETT